MALRGMALPARAKYRMQRVGSLYTIVNGLPVALLSVCCAVPASSVPIANGFPASRWASMCNGTPPLIHRARSAEGVLIEISRGPCRKMGIRSRKTIFSQENRGETIVSARRAATMCGATPGARRALGDW